MSRFSAIRHVLAALVFGAGLFGSTHFHFPDGSVGQGDGSMASACGCFHHPDPTPQHPGPTNTDDCSVCKLLAQLSADHFPVDHTVTSDLVTFSLLELDAQTPVAIATSYWSRGPPLI